MVQSNMSIVRKSISFPDDLERAVARRAKKYNRSFSAQVVSDMQDIIERAARRSTMVADGNGGYKKVSSHAEE